METTTVPITVNHQGQFPVVTLSFNLAPSASLGDAVTAVNKVHDEMGMPPSIQAAYQGTAEAFQASLANEPVLIAAALITVYLVLGILYESYIHPADDPVRAAFGGRRRFARAHHLPATISA